MVVSLGHLNSGDVQGSFKGPLKRLKDCASYLQRAPTEQPAPGHRLGEISLPATAQEQPGIFLDDRHALRLGQIICLETGVEECPNHAADGLPIDPGRQQREGLRLPLA